MIGNALPLRLQLEASTAPLAAIGFGPNGQNGAPFVLPAMPSGDEDALALPMNCDENAKDGQSEYRGDDMLAAIPLVVDMPHYIAAPAAMLEAPVRSAMEPSAADADTDAAIDALPAASPAQGTVLHRIAALREHRVDEPTQRLAPATLPAAAVPTIRTGEQISPDAATMPDLPTLPGAQAKGAAASAVKSGGASVPKGRHMPIAPLAGGNEPAPDNQVARSPIDVRASAPAATESAETASSSARTAHPMFAATADKPADIAAMGSAPKAQSTQVLQSADTPRIIETTSRTEEPAANRAAAQIDSSTTPTAHVRQAGQFGSERPVSAQPVSIPAATNAMEAVSRASVPNPAVQPAAEDADPIVQATPSAIEATEPARKEEQRSGALRDANPMLDIKASERPVQPVLKSSSLGENDLPHRTVYSAQALETPQPAAVFQVPPPAQNGPQQAAANAPTIFTAPAPVPFDAQFGQRVSAAIGAAMNAMTVQDGTLMLQISPERLGRIEIAIDRASERLQITTENESVRGAIAQAHSRIEQELRAAGQRIGTIDVATRDASTGTGQGQNQNQPQAGTDQQRGQQNAAQQSFGRMGIDGRRAAPEIDTPSRPNGRPSSNILYA